jgi:hypothetical protein
MSSGADGVGVPRDHLSGQDNVQLFWRNRGGISRGLPVRPEMLEKIFAMTARHNDSDILFAAQLFGSHCRDHLQTAIARNFCVPGKSKCAGGSHAYSDTGKAAGADIDHDTSSAAAIGQVRNERQQAFGMAATDHFVIGRDKNGAVK